jgi:transposase-like protein
MPFRTKTEKEQYLASQRKSGLSISAYCQREGIHQNTFYNWRKRLGPVKTGCKSVAPVSFLQLPSPQPDAQKFDLTLPNGSRLTMPMTCDPSFLRQAIRMLSPLRPR